MTWWDAVIIVVVVLSALAGIFRGFLRGLLDVAVILISLTSAAFAYPWVADLVRELLDARRIIVNVLAFILVAGGVQGLLTFALLGPLSPVIRGLRALPTVRWIDSVFGLLPGALKGLALATALTLAVTLLPVSRGLGIGLGGSGLAQPLVRVATDLAYHAQESTNIDLADFTVVMTPGDEHSRRLPFSLASATDVDPRGESQLLDLVNDERQRRGLPALVVDETLVEVARRHSQDMLEHGYFSHVSPTTGSPTDRFLAGGVDFLVAGENLAYAPSIPIAHEGLMNSPGHRANILSPDFTRIGIGIIGTPFGSKMVTEEFAGP